AILFIPVIIGMNHLYSWANWTEAAKQVAPHKAVFFSKGFFVGRAIIYFAIWLTIATLLNLLSAREDEAPGPMRILRIVSGPGIAFYGIFITFASIDWVMSMQPFWYSSMWGLIYIAGQGLSCMSFMVILVAILHEQPPIKRLVSPGVFN